MAGSVSEERSSFAAPAVSPAGRVGIGLMVVSSLGWAAGVAFGDLEHVFDRGWPDHARFHALQALMWLIALTVSVVAVVAGPLRRHERWSLWLLAALLVLGQGSYFASMVVVPGGAPTEWYATPLSALNIALYAFGLWLCRREQRPACT